MAKKRAAPKKLAPVFRQILVPVDLSNKNLTAIQAALALARSTGAATTILHVVQTVEGLPFEDLSAFYSDLEKKARRALDDHSARFRDEGLDVQEAIVFGQPLEEILAFARSEKTDLIVMCSHKLDPARPLEGWGTLSYKVATLCACPVLLAK